ncbi:MAG: hypothetical protein CUN54_10690, partial [Phototrophicales bacterium]
FPFMPFSTFIPGQFTTNVNCVAVLHDSPQLIDQNLRCQKRSINFCNLDCDGERVQQQLTNVLHKAAAELRMEQSSSGGTFLGVRSAEERHRYLKRRLMDPMRYNLMTD